MTAPLAPSSFILRKRLGMYMKALREDIGMTQLDVAVLLDYGYPAMVSQMERGHSALPPHDMILWSEVLRIDAADLAKKWLYFVEPDVYRALYGVDPYVLEKLPRSLKTIKSAPGRSAASRGSRDS